MVDRASVNARTAADEREALRRALAELSKEACQRLGSGPLPQAVVGLPKYDGSGHGTLVQVSVPTTTPLASFFAQGLESWPSLAAFVEIARSLRRYRRVLLTDAAGNGLPEQAVSQALRMVAHGFIDDYLNAAGQAVWDDVTFERIWSVFERSARTARARVQYWAPLYGCHYDGDVPAEVAEDVTLMEPSAHTRLMLSQYEPPSRFGFGVQFYLVQRRTVIMKGPYGPGTLGPISLCGLAIRLVAGGQGRTSLYCSIPEPGTPRGFGSLGWASGVPSTGTLMFVPTTTVLTPAHLPQVAALVPKLEAAREHFAIAFERLEMEAGKFGPVERLVDLVVALESMLIPASSFQGELSFRLALTGAWILGADASDRAEWLKKLRKVYSVRSLIVHGRPGTIRKLTQQVLDDAEAATRRIGRIAAEGEFSHPAWERQLQEIVLGT